MRPPGIETLQRYWRTIAMYGKGTWPLEDFAGRPPSRPDGQDGERWGADLSPVDPVGLARSTVR
ncbi:hypothetical protein [Planotetraspora silvatica]|uniref:hypothetical protein n=1 Tax=Planotetraspora silvatica TaxID=234614 RepID=UPI00194F1D41|nr:hypothetical protein [Planotetraspora silvatica]